MQVTIYHLKQLPLGLEELRENYDNTKSKEDGLIHDQAVIDFRKSLEFPCWPYNDDEHMEVFCDYLREMEVFYYVDDLNYDGGRKIAFPIHPYTESFYENLKTPLVCYRSRVYIYHSMNTPDELLYTPMQWPYDNDSEGQKLKHMIQQNPITSDNLAWAELNKDVKVLECDYKDAIRVDLRYKPVKAMSLQEAPDNSKYEKKDASKIQENK